MVRFTENGFTIEYKTVAPVDEWRGLYEDISYVFSTLNGENMPREGLWRLGKLIEAMIPDIETSERMM